MDEGRIDQGHCPQCQPARAVYLPSVIADGVEWQFCMEHMRRWRVGAAIEPSPAPDINDEFLSEFVDV